MPQPGHVGTMVRAMDLNPVGIAVPFFFLLIGVELLVARWQGKRFYRLNDALADLGSGMGDQLIGVFSAGATFAMYVLIHDQYSVANLSASSPWTWVLAFLGVDFFYYWYHRFSHRAAVGWATHVVHHQSEEYNLAVALRQSWFTKFYSWMFYIPLAAVGVPPAVYGAASAFNLLYQFWIHTRTVGRLGPLEWVFNTPSHHRVHHGTNPEYLDKNYAGFLIIWDRMFGTFEPEANEVVYGVLKPVRSWNPFRVNIEPLVSLFRTSMGHARFVDRVLTWFAPPGWFPGAKAEDYVLPFPSPARGYDADAPQVLKRYVLAHFLPIGVLMTVVIAYKKYLDLTPSIAASAFVFCTLGVWAGFFESRRWAMPLEAARLCLMVAGASWIAYTMPAYTQWAALVGIGTVVSAAWLLRYHLASRAQPA